MPKPRDKQHGDSSKQGTSRVINRDGDGNILNKNGSIRKTSSLKSKIDGREKKNQSNKKFERESPMMYTNNK